MCVDMGVALDEEPGDDSVVCVEQYDAHAQLAHLCVCMCADVCIDMCIDVCVAVCLHTCA